MPSNSEWMLIGRELVKTIKLKLDTNCKSIMSIQKFTNKTAINNNKNAQVKGRPSFLLRVILYPTFMFSVPHKQM